MKACVYWNDNTVSNVAAQMVSWSLNIYAQSVTQARIFREKAWSKVQRQFKWNQTHCWFKMNPNVLSCHNAQGADREDNLRVWANFWAKFNSLSFCISYVILYSTQRSGTVPCVLKRLKAIFYLMSGFLYTQSCFCVFFGRKWGTIFRGRLQINGQKRTATQTFLPSI